MTMFLYNILTNLTEMMVPGSRRNGSALAAGGGGKNGQDTNAAQEDTVKTPRCMTSAGSWTGPMIQKNKNSASWQIISMVRCSFTHLCSA